MRITIRWTMTNGQQYGPYAPVPDDPFDKTIAAGIFGWYTQVVLDPDLNPNPHHEWETKDYDEECTGYTIETRDDCYNLYEDLLVIDQDPATQEITVNSDPVTGGSGGWRTTTITFIYTPIEI